MDLNGAVDFATDSSGPDMLQAMLSEFRQKTQEMGFYDQRVAFNNYHDDMEEELKAAYDQTVLLEKDMKRLFTIAEVLMEKQEEYENKMADMQSETSYIQDHKDLLRDREREKDQTIINMEAKINDKDKTIATLKSTVKSLQGQIEDLEEEIDKREEELATANETSADRIMDLEENIKTLQELVEYKNNYNIELQQNIDKIDIKCEELEKLNDRLENVKEKLTKDLADTKSNMNHYRASCQRLSKELEAASESLNEMQSKYEVMLRKQYQMNEPEDDDGGNELAGLETQDEGHHQEQSQDLQPDDDQDMIGDTLGDELADMEALGNDFNSGEGSNDGIIDGDAEIIDQYDDEMGDEGQFTDVQDMNNSIDQNSVDNEESKFETSNELQNITEDQTQQNDINEGSKPELTSTE